RPERAGGLPVQPGYGDPDGDVAAVAGADPAVLRLRAEVPHPRRRDDGTEVSAGAEAALPSAPPVGRRDGGPAAHADVAVGPTSETIAASSPLAPGPTATSACWMPTASKGPAAI